MWMDSDGEKVKSLSLKTLIDMLNVYFLTETKQNKSWHFYKLKIKYTVVFVKLAISDDLIMASQGKSGSKFNHLITYSQSIDSLNTVIMYGI